MAELEHTEKTEHSAPDEASEWYASRHAALLQQADASLNQLAEGYTALDNAWNTLNERENQAHEELDTRVIVAIQAERQRLQSEAAQIQQGWHNLHIEKAKLEQSNDPTFSELLSASSQPAQMFLRSHRSRLENDPNALKQLMFADARAKAAGLKPDSKHYFSALEAAVGLDASDRNLDDFKGEFDDNTNTYKVERKEKSRATPEQRVMARNLPGISEDEYLKACAQPFSKAATVTVEPDALDFGHGNKGMEVKFEQEKPTRKTIDPAKYKPSQNSVTLSPAQVKFCESAGIDPKEYAKNTLAVQKGETTHQWYEQRLRSQGLA